jgi:hypothetical protein
MQTHCNASSCSSITRKSRAINLKQIGETMPLVKKRLFLTAGSTSDQVLAGTTYEYVDPNTVIRVAAAVDTAGTSATADTTMDFTVNNAEFSRNASVSALVTGEPFGASENSSYTMNNMITTGAIRNRPIITFTNTTSGTRTVDVAVFIGN